jgi:hypothetical protein
MWKFYIFFGGITSAPSAATVSSDPSTVPSVLTSTAVRCIDLKDDAVYIAG